MLCKPIQHFLELCKIPHASGDEARIAQYMVEFGEKLGLESIRDAENNVIIRKPGTKGRENDPMLILQSHTDMVYIKDPDCTHDYESPLDVIIEDGYIFAKGTSLGADDCMGVALTMALLEADDIPHPPIEAIFTSGEEVGMTGAIALNADDIKGRTMINIDTENDDEIIVGCAGGIAAEFTLPLIFEKPQGGKAYKIKVSGLLGGHSGQDIDKGLGNSIRLLSRVLFAASKAGAAISSINGGDKGNAIPAGAQAIVVGDENKLKELVKSFDATFKNELRDTDPGVCVSLEACDMPDGVFDDFTAETALTLLLNLPLGPQSFTGNIVESSCNNGVISTENNTLKISFSIRSSMESLKQHLYEKTSLMVSRLGGSSVIESSYSGWEPAPQSKIRDIAIEAYKELWGDTPEAKPIHAGLECSFFKKLHPDMDIISIGPNTYAVHSPREKVEVASVEKLWAWLQKIVSK